MKKIDAVQIPFWRGMLKLPWTAQKTYLELMEAAGQTRSFCNRTGRQAVVIVHVVRREGLDHFITARKLDGRERQRNKR